MVGRKSSSEGLDVVVGSLNEGLSGEVVSHRLLRGAGRHRDEQNDQSSDPLRTRSESSKNTLELLVVRSSGSGVDESTGDSRDEERVGDLELDGVVDLLLLGLEHRVELLGLGDRSGESVKDETECPKRHEGQEGLQKGRESGRETHPSWHSLFSSSCFLIMLIMMSSETRPPYGVKKKRVVSKERCTAESESGSGDDAPGP